MEAYLNQIYADFIAQMHEDIKNDNPEFMKNLDQNDKDITILLAKQSRSILKYNESIFQKYGEDCLKVWCNIRLAIHQGTIENPEIEDLTRQKLDNYQSLFTYLLFCLIDFQNKEKLNKLDH